MDILFENSFIRTKELLKEIYRYFYFKRPINIIFEVILGLLFLGSIIFKIIYPYYNNVALIAAPIFIFWQFYFYFKSVNTMVKRDNEINGGNPIRIDTVVTDEFIQTTSSMGTVSKTPYSNMRYAVQTKNCIILRSKANLLYVFGKDTFSKGTPDEFLSFLRQKGFKINNI